MSTLKVNAIQDANGANESTAAQINVGRCKAWGTFKGSGTPSVILAHNFSSLTDISQGKYRLNFTTPFVDTNYCCAGNSGKGDTNDDGNAHIQIGGTNSAPTLLTTSVTVRTKVSSNINNQEPDKFHVMIHR